MLFATVVQKYFHFDLYECHLVCRLFEWILICFNILVIDQGSGLVSMYAKLRDDIQFLTPF